ncbi:LacI family DNA-binding transcriptional regulator [Isoptericola halotolerans]|uniref:LacI family DNA-binding transcriptional regulator n=1 Tax=Isoptericola halotolerans TaxID=300560 RepID=UPI00389048E2
MTIADVARAAAVSTATVSNVINDVPRMSQETRQRVLQVMDDLGYRPDPTARNLRAGRTDVVGLLVPELDRPYFGQLATAIADGVEARGRRLVLQRSGTGAKEVEAAAFARLRMYDAVIISVVGLDAAELERLNFTTPVVLVGERPVSRGFDHVMMDNVAGARLAVDHLLAGGARRVALLGGGPGDDPRGMVAQRYRGWRQAHEVRGVTADPRLVMTVDALDLEGGRQAVHELTRVGVPFDGVFAVTDVVAFGALRGLAELGLRVPDDVQVVGFDDILESRYCVPSLTTVDAGRDAIAAAVLDLLDVRMRQERKSAAGTPGDDRMAPREIVVPATLVHRESTRG